MDRNDIYNLKTIFIYIYLQKFGFQLTNQSGKLLTELLQPSHQSVIYQTMVKCFLILKIKQAPVRQFGKYFLILDTKASQKFVKIQNLKYIGKNQLTVHEINCHGNFGLNSAVNSVGIGPMLNYAIFGFNIEREW